MLDDDVDADWCTVEWFYDMGAMNAELGGRYRESSFLEHSKRMNTGGAAIAPAPRSFIEASSEWRQALTGII